MIARLAMLAATLLVLCAVWRFAHFSLNVTASMPIGLYRDEPFDHPARRGDIVVVCAPPAAASMAAARGYVPGGPCDHDTAPLLKYVAAVGGDAIDIDASGVRVNGALLPHTQALRRDGAGRPMHAFARRHERLAENEVWLYAPEPRSFDSRYFGPVRASAIVSFAKLLI